MILESSLSNFDDIHQSIILINRKFEILYLNEHFRLLHRAGLSFQPEALEQLFNSEDLQKLKGTIETCQNCSLTIQLRLKSSDFPTTERILNFSIKKFSFLSESYILTEFTDQPLWLEYFDLINTYSNDLLGVVNEKFEIEFISPSITEVMGYSQEEFRLVDPFSIVHPEEYEPFKRNLLGAISQRQNKLSIVNRFQKKNGEYFWADNNLRLIYDPYNKDSFKIIAVTRDITNMVQTQQDLAETKYLLEEAQKLAKIGHWELNLDTEELKWPPSMSLLYGNDPDQPPKTGREFLQFIHAEDHDLVSREYNKLLEINSLTPGEHKEFQFRIITPAGKVKYIKTRFRLEPNRNYAKGINIDVTTESEKQQRLLNTELKYRKLVDLCPFGIGITKDNKRIYVNKKLGELFEVDQKEFAGYPLDAFAVGETKTLITDRLKNIIRGKKIDNHFTGKFRTAITGTIKTFEIFTADITWEGENARLALIIDITELKNTQEKIVQSETMLRLAQEFAGIVSWHLNLKDNAQRLAEMEEPSFIQGIHEDDRAAVLKEFKDCINGNSPYDVEFRIKTDSGNVLWVEEKGDVIKDAVGTPVEMYGATRDITKEKLKEHELLQAKNIAEESYKNQEAFLSIMSHEIRTPLNAVLGLTDLLIRKNPPNKKSEILTALKNSCDNLMHVVNGLLDLTKSNANKYQLETIRFNIHELLTQLESSYRFLAQEKGITFHLLMDKNLPVWVVGDMVKLYQVLNNLLDNAVKFTRHGFVRLHAQALQLSQDHCTLQFNVEDTGAGITKQKLNHIFETFRQPTLSVRKRSSGLGLTIVKNLVSQLNGSFSIESEPGSGTMSSLTIPFHVVTLSVDVNVKDTVKQLRNKKILYVEDVDTNQYVIQNLLEMHHAVCDVASTGSIAVRLLKKKKYDLLLLDLLLPDINGYKLLDFARTSKLNRSIPVIVFTADVTDTTRSSINDPDVKEFIYKPFISDNLLQKIAQVISHEKNINMDYYERIFKKNKAKLAKAKELILSDLHEFKQKNDVHFNKRNLLGLKKSIHKIKVTTKNINALKLLRLLEKVYSKSQYTTAFPKYQHALNKELNNVIKAIECM